MLLWTWLLCLVTLLFRILPTRDVGLRDSAFGVLLANALFLIVILIFAADPFKPSLGTPRQGLGLGPVAATPRDADSSAGDLSRLCVWSVPFALAVAGLLHKAAPSPQPLSPAVGERGWGEGAAGAAWTEMARPWALLAWAVLAGGLLLGADWAYEVLGWGGYWGWDPVESGSLLPWLTGTALIHCLMAWRYRQCLKKTAVALAILTCALCNFATFLTRSGIFGSVHAFGTSPIGWMFLAFMAALILSGLVLIVLRRQACRPNA